MSLTKWDVTTIGALFDIGAGRTMSEAARQGTDKVPFLRTSNVLWDQVDLTSVDEMAARGGDADDKLLAPGDLLVCEGGEIGRAAVWNGEIVRCSFQNHLHRLRPRSPEVIPRFYVYYLHAALTQLGLFAGAANTTTIPNLSRSRLAALEVPWPLREDQERIVHVLSTVRNSIALHHRSIALSYELRAVASNRFFASAHDDSDTPSGEPATSKKSVSIGELGDVVTGTTPPTKNADYYSGGVIPFIAPGDIEHGRPTVSASKKLTTAGLSVSRSLPAGSTLVVCIGSTIGKVGQTTDEQSATNQQINAILPSDSYFPGYVTHLLSWNSEAVRSAASPSPVPIISKGAFKRIQLEAATCETDQRRAVEVLDTINAKIDAHIRKTEPLEELYSLLLRRLMTCEIDVGELDLDAAHDADRIVPGESAWPS